MSNQNASDEQFVEGEIDDLNRGIDTIEDVDPLFLQEELRELRHRTMYVHARLETSLGILLWSWIINPVRESLPFKSLQNMGSRFDLVISEADFGRKVYLARKLGFIDEQLKGSLLAVNNLRIKFSHPKAYETDIRELLDRKNYLKALRMLKKAFDEMDDLFAVSSVAPKKQK